MGFNKWNNNNIFKMIFTALQTYHMFQRTKENKRMQNTIHFYKLNKKPLFVLVDWFADALISIVSMVLIILKEKIVKFYLGLKRLDYTSHFPLCPWVDVHMSA